MKKRRIADIRIYFLGKIVSERKLTKTVISSKARNLIVLKIQALKISPYGRNDKKRGFRSGTK